MMQHMENSMIGGVLDNNVWYVDFGASNHMINHGEWFRDTRDLKTLRFVEIGDDTTHPHHTNWQGGIVHARWVNKVLERCILCSNHNKKFSLDKPDGGTRFTSDIQPKWMFCGRHEVNMLEVSSMLFTHGKGARDIGIWHKQVSHVNPQRLKLMEKKKSYWRSS